MNRVIALRGVISLCVSLALVSSLAFMPVVADRAYAASDASSSLAAGGGDSLDVEVSTQAVKNGWSADGESYYRNGKKVVGIQEIDGKRYCFTDGGTLRHHYFDSQGATYYVDENGVLLGAKLYGQYYYDTLKPMTAADSYDFDTLLWARSIVYAITDWEDSREDKLWAAFCYVKDMGYAIHQNFDPNEENWMATYARYHFNGEGGDCHSDGAAFAYLAAAIGYEADVCIDSWASGYAPSHCWTMIGDAVYDPLFYESKSTMYYGATSGTYQTSPTARFRVPTYSSSHADPNAASSDELLQAGYAGLQKIGGNYYYFKDGSPVKSAWKTIDGKRYYFNKKGVAVTSGAKIKGKYYVFNTKGQLLTSKKKGVRTVKVAGTYYRVNEKGRAVGGYSADGKMRSFRTGKLIVGIRVGKGKFYAANSKGIYNKKKTKALRKAAKPNKPAVKLYQLLGKPMSVHYSTNCEGKGYDGLWVYKNFIVTTIRPAGVKKISKVATALDKGKKLPSKYEYFVSCEARK